MANVIAQNDIRILTVNAPSRTYPINIGREWLNRAFLEQLASQRKIVIITDSNLFAIYNDLLKDFDVYVIEAGEASKCMTVYSDIQTYLIEKNLTRSDAVVAFGGGVTGDLAGFVASTYMRGIGFIQIPTSLLAMVDSSVGGKVAINHSFGKNIIGNFYQPEAVHIDTALLKTLPDREIACGMAEVIKYGMIYDYDFFVMLKNLSKTAFDATSEEIIETCCKIKAKVVAEDEEDKGIRQILNFGHTIGHAVEAYYNYSRYEHGEAVAIGMYLKSKLAFQKGIIKKEDFQDVEEVLKKYNLPIDLETPEDYPMIIKEIIHDKKAEGSTFKLIELKSIGEVAIVSYTYDEIMSLLKA